MNTSSMKQETGRLDLLQFLHFGFAALCLFYLSLHVTLKATLHNLFQDPETLAILYEVYGIRFEQMLPIMEKTIWVSAFFLLVTACVNLGAGWALRKRIFLQYLRWTAWINIGLFPVGTVLGFLTLSALKKEYTRSLFTRPT